MKNLFKDLIEDFSFSRDIKQDAYNFLIKHNRKTTAEHSLRVARKAKEIAGIYGFNEELAEIAGLLHDIGGVYPYDKMVELSHKIGLSVLAEEVKFPLILHQKLSEVLAKEIFNVDCTDVLRAIGCHTTLKSDASLLDMIIFVADKIEWDQKDLPPYINEVEKSLDVSIELAAFSYIKYQLEHREKLRVIHPWLAEAYKDLEKRLSL